MQRRWLAVLAVVSAVATGCGGGGDEPDPAADRAAAQKANLKAADFPAGWTGKPYEEQPADEEIATEVPECLGISPPSARATAEVGSPNFTSGLATQARSVITFVESEEQAEKDAAAFASDRFAECAEPHFARQVGEVAPEGGTVENLEITKARFPRLGERTVAHRVNATIRIGEMRVPINIDLVRIFEGRAEVAFTFINPGEPFPEDLARSLAGKVVERL